MSFGHGALSARLPRHSRCGMELDILMFRKRNGDVPVNSSCRMTVAHNKKT
jgi:hypothetical protein